MVAVTDLVWVVDVECTCWETRQEQADRPSEIIEIGICGLLPHTGEIIYPESYVVKPRFSSVSPFCTQLTSWTQEEVDKGHDIEVVLKSIKQDYGILKEHVWFSCGEFDRTKLASDGKGGVQQLYGIQKWDNPFAMMRSHFNVKTLFALKHKLFKEKDLMSMLDHLQLKFEGTHHRGKDDAINVARIVSAVLT